MNQWQRITHDLIDRVRSASGHFGLTTLQREAEEWLRQEPDALASQPEAPECNYVGRCNSARCPKHGQPEAPKEQADDYEPSGQTMAVMGWTPEAPKEQADDPTLAGSALLLRDLAAAKVKIEELEADNVRARNLVRQSQEDYDGQRKATEAANARADAAEREAERWEVCAKDLHAERIAESSRADAAERHVTEWKRLHGEAATLWREAGDKADQLAARVTSLQAELDIAWADDDPKETCTPEERKVLDAMARADITFDTHGHRRAIFDNSLHEILACEAELANRAAKAKREAK